MPEKFHWKTHFSGKLSNRRGECSTMVGTHDQVRLLGNEYSILMTKQLKQQLLEQ